MNKNTVLLAIDCQNDFTDYDSGSLYVPGADLDMLRLADFIEKTGENINIIFSSIDQHRTYHISHASFWIDSLGNQPKPFTQITYNDFSVGKWIPKDQSVRSLVGSYLQKLEQQNQYQHTIFPEHCLKYSSGAALLNYVDAAFHKWERTNNKLVDFIPKGSHPFTEHFSCFQAAVPYQDAPETQLNTKLIAELEQADEIVVAGEALSHCVRYSVTDLIKNFSNPESASKIVLLKDCCSSVVGFEQQGKEFMKQLVAWGGRVTTSFQYLKGLK